MHTDGDFQIQFGKSMYAEAARDANKCQGIFDFFRAHLSADWRIMATDFVVAQLAHDAEVNSPEQVEATVSAWDSLLNDKDGDVQAAAQDVVDQLLNHKVSRKLTVHQLGAVILSLSRA